MTTYNTLIKEHNKNKDDIVGINEQLAEKAKQIDLNNTNANVTLKADKSYVDNQIANVASGSPKGVFATLTELQTAFPTGTTGTYIVSTDGKLYGWINGAWASIVQYQSTGFADKSISKIKTDFFGQGKNYIDFSKTISGYFVNQTTGTFDASASHRRTEKLPCKPNQSYIFGAFSKSTGLYSSSTTLNCAFRYAFYDSNDQYISGALNTPSFTAPTNAVTIAISWNNSNDASYNFQLEEGTVVTTYESYNLQIDESNLKLTNVKNDINTLKTVTTKATTKATNIIFEETFKSSIPSHLTNSGGFTISDGLVSPATTGYDKQIYYNKEVCLDKEKIYVDFVLTNLSTKIGVGFRSAIAGLLCEVDFISNKLIIRNAWSDPTLTTPPTVYKELALTFTPVLNRKYSIIVEKDTRKNCSITIKDVLTFENTKLDCVEQLTTSPANAWGGACIVAISGSFKVTKFVFLNNQPSSPKLAIYGDSFIEGSTIMPNIDQRYASKIKTLLNGGCIIGGKGGDYAYGLLQKISTYGLFRPKYTLLSIGLNDTSFTQYKSSIESLIQWCESIGSIPILTTITRNMSTDNLVFMQQVNNYVRTSGYRYVDFAQVMSLNYDGETQNTSLFLADKIHPNLDGHEKMYQKFIADLPEIFDVA